MKTLDKCIRDLRKGKGMLVREVAAGLEIDPSLLSRIERGEKIPTRRQVVKLSEILDGDPQEFIVLYLSERLLREVKDEALAMRAIVMAGERIGRQGKCANKMDKVFRIMSGLGFAEFPLSE